MTRRFEEVAVGEELEPLARVVTREDVRVYAETGGDANPLHQDDDVAREAGFDGIIAHGMFTMGHMAACVIRWAGDEDAIAGINAQFRAPVSMGETILAGGRVRSVDPEARTALVDTWVSLERDGETLWPIKRGQAEVRLA